MFEHRPHLIAVRGFITTVCLSILAACGGGDNPTSSSSNSSTEMSSSSSASVPAVPVGVTATAGNAQVKLTWTASSDATSYHVKRATTSGGPYSQIAAPTSNTYTDTSLINGATYYYVISALFPGGESANSAQASGTPNQTSWPAGDPGCGLSSAAFCDTFDAPATSLTGRSYELDASRWSLARNAPDLGKPNEIIGSAMILQCRSDIPSAVSPPGDTRICNGNSAIQSNFLKTATGAQNYGSNAYRIRQPFDFAGRTGKIVFDADATAIGLLGWIAIAVTEDPTPSPSFSNLPGWDNFEGGVIPKNGITIEMEGTCNPGETRVDMIHEYRNYADYDHDFALGQAPCFSVSRYHLNHFELRLSQTRVELWATPFSDDGVHFGALSLVASANLGLTFSRGYVQLIGRNHATRKYWTTSNPVDTQDAWIVSWDNVGFDGPVVNNTKEFEAPDALVKTSTGVDVGYFLNDSIAAQKTTVTIRGVTGAATAVRARLAMNVHYWGNFTNATSNWGLIYRLNGKAWHTYTLTPEEQAIYNSGVVFKGDKVGQANALSKGVLGNVFDVPVSDLIDGDNVLEIATSNVPFAGYPPTLSNLDLILTTP